MDWTETNNTEPLFLAMMLEKLGGEVKFSFEEILNFPSKWEIVREDFADLSTSIKLIGEKMGTFPTSNKDIYAEYLGIEESPFAPYNEDKGHDYDETISLRLTTIEAWISNWTPRIQQMEKDIESVTQILKIEAETWIDHLKFQHGMDIEGTGTPESVEETYDCLNCTDYCEECPHYEGDVYDEKEYEDESPYIREEIWDAQNGHYVDIFFPDTETAEKWGF